MPPWRLLGGTSFFYGSGFMLRAITAKSSRMPANVIVHVVGVVSPQGAALLWLFLLRAPWPMGRPARVQLRFGGLALG